MSRIKSISRIFLSLLVALSFAFSNFGIASTRVAYAKNNSNLTGLNENDWAQIKAQMPTTAINAQQAYIKASNTEPSSSSSFRGDKFGYSMALSGDTLVIAAPYEDSNATGVNGDQANNAAIDSGAVYVFVRNGSTWSQQAYLKASNTEAYDNFGNAVAISGDTIVVAADQEDSNATGVNGNQTDNTVTDSGAVYVFTRNGTDWSQQAYIKASNTDAYDYFGYSIAVNGDTLVVGAGDSSNASGINGNQTDNSLPYSGAVYVFTRSGTDWSQQAYIKASNPGAQDVFGISVSLDADTLAVGAYDESSNATGVNGAQNNNLTPNSGAAYVFTRSGTDWSQQAYIKASNTGADDEFGISIAVASDTLVVGAPYEDSNARGINGDQTNNLFTDAGAAYVFTRSGTIWSQQAYLKESNTAEADLLAKDSFGTSVAISGDRILIGAPNESSNITGVNGTLPDTQPFADDSGAAYLFTRNDNLWKQQAFIKASNTYIGDHFGSSVALDGDTVVTGAPNEQSVATGINGDQTNNPDLTYDLTWGAGSAYALLMPPLVTSIARADANPTTAASVNFTVSFSEPMTGVDVSDFQTTATGTLTEVSITGVSGGPTTYTVNVALSATGTGTIRLDVLDDDTIQDADLNPLGGTGLGNGDFTVGQVYTIDRSGPHVVSILRASGSPTSLTFVDFNVTFSEAVTGVNLSDFQLVTSGVTGAAILSVDPTPGDASKYVVTVKTGLHIGSIRLNLVDNDSILDDVANPLGGPGAGNGNFTGQAYYLNRVYTVGIFSISAQGGWVLESAENSNVGGTLKANSGSFPLGDDALNRQYRVILSFPTASLPDGAVIKSAFIKMRDNAVVVGSNPFNSLGNIWADIRKGTFGTVALQLSDFSAPASASKVGYFKHGIFNDYTNTLNAAGLSNINKTGPTQFRLYFAIDDNNNHKADFIKFDSYYQSVTRPQLMITYSLP